MNREDFNITKPPAAGTPEVGEWAWNVFETSQAWRDDELGQDEIWRQNHKLYRGNHWGNRKNKNTITVGLNFSNIERTCANMTANKPRAEVVDLDGTDPDSAKVASARLRKWWDDTKQTAKHRVSIRNSEIYGISWEKAAWNANIEQPNIIVCDPYAVFPYPGYYEDMAKDCPAISHAIAIDPLIINQQYNTDEKIEISETYTLLGGEREDNTNKNYGMTSATTTVTAGNSGLNQVKTALNGSDDDNKALVVEVWCRDYSGQYPGNIRVITVTNNGALVLRDGKNPNINFAFDEKIQESNYLFDRLPFTKGNSYSDSTSIFGFSAAEHTARINLKIDELVSRITSYAMKAMSPILVVPKTTGIKASHLSNLINLIVFPDTESGAGGIKYVPMPNLPPVVMDTLNMLMGLHDRIHAVQDVDRGEAPKQVTAASAIMALQERNATLIKAKVDSSDDMIAWRGNVAMALFQMHGHSEDAIEVDGVPMAFKGISFAGNNFNYLVTAGSTMVRSEAQIGEQMMDLANNGWVDQQALLESLNIPNAGEIIERMAEDQLGQVLGILVQSGMPEEEAQALIQQLQETQGAPGNRPEQQQAYQRSQQGELPE